MSLAGRDLGRLHRPRVTLWAVPLAPRHPFCLVYTFLSALCEPSSTDTHLPLFAYRYRARYRSLPLSVTHFVCDTTPPIGATMGRRPSGRSVVWPDLWVSRTSSGELLHRAGRSATFGTGGFSGRRQADRS